jgi:chromate transporter
MENPSLFRLASSFFKINLVTFGGGYSIIPVISKQYVEKWHYLNEEEMLDLIALCPSVPGAMAVNTSVLVGYKLRGKKGALASLIGAILPPLFVITAVFYFYAEFQSNPYIQAILNGMRGAVSAVMLYATYKMAKAALKTNTLFSILMMVVVFILGSFTDIPTAVLILSSGLIGFIYFKLIKTLHMKGGH